MRLKFNFLLKLRLKCLIGLQRLVNDLKGQTSKQFKKKKNKTKLIKLHNCVLCQETSKYIGGNILGSSGVRVGGVHWWWWWGKKHCLLCVLVDFIHGTGKTVVIHIVNMWNWTTQYALLFSFLLIAFKRDHCCPPPPFWFFYCCFFFFNPVLPDQHYMHNYYTSQYYVLIFIISTRIIHLLTL